MAQHVKITLISDISGEEASETIKFGLDGMDYEVDATEAEAADIRENFGTYVAYARRLARSASAKKSATPTSRDYDPKAVRVWATSNGIEVSERGRVSADVVAKYKAAGN